MAIRPVRSAPLRDSRVPATRSGRAAGRFRSLLTRALVCACLVAALVLSGSAHAGVPITLFRSFAGNLDFQGTAGTLRVGACGVATSGSGTLAGVPASATIRAAYLYWAGSGSTVDASVTLDSPGGAPTTVAANRTFTETYNNGGTNLDFFSGFADVTSIVASGANGVYTLSNLIFNTGAPHSGVAACLGGWSLIVIYENVGEPLRVVNVFDGFESFRGNAITLTPNNFVVPASPINGKLGHITWEGDVGNSAVFGGFEEQLRFQGAVLTDVDNPSNNQFNSLSNVTIPTSGLEGVDFDVYPLASPLLVAGQSSGVTRYSSGGDLVLLSAEVFSVTNTPVADLSIAKTAAGDFGAGEIGSWSLAVSNSGPNADPGPIQLTDTLPSGTSFDSAIGAGWSCSESSGTVTCTHPGPLAAGASLPPVVLDVLVDASAAPSVDNTASVSGTLFDNVPSNNSSTVTTNVVFADLSTSTKSVVDLSGGEVAPGDVLRYTIQLVETNGSSATATRVTDDIPGNVDSFALVNLPPGTTDLSSAAPTGANGTGYLDLQGIVVPANGSVDIVFDVTVAVASAPGAVLSNTAAVTPGAGTGGLPAAPDVVVLASQVPGAGSKLLYLGNPSAPGATRALSRRPPNGLPPSSTLGNVPIDTGTSETWTLAEALAAQLSLSGADFPVALMLRKGGTSSSAVSRDLRIEVASTSLGPIATTTQTVSLTGTPQELAFTMSPGGTLPAALPPGDAITLTVTNQTPGSGTRRVRVFPAIAGASGGHSRVELNATTVINVDDVSGYDVAFPGGSIPTSFAPGETVSLRAVVSDPFGAFDIASATLELRDALGSTVLGPVLMSDLAAAQTASTKTFEVQHTLAANAELGTWNAFVTAVEGEESTVTDLGIGSFVVRSDPDVVVFKLVSVLDDPVNGTANPKAIPGATVVYTIGISNQGSGAADVDSLLIEDVLPSELELFVAAFGNRGPLQFTDGTPNSGIDIVFNALADDFDDLEFDDGSGNWTLDPVADAEGFDASVSAIRIRPSGTLAGSSGTPPSFEVRFRGRVK